jgi:hypothetical protein
MKDGAFNRWMAYLLIRNSNKAKYGSLSNGLVLQFSIQNNQYTKSCTTATDILSNHRFDNRGDSNGKKWSNKTRKDEDETNSNTSSKMANETNATSFVQGGNYNTLLLGKDRTPES